MGGNADRRKGGFEIEAKGYGYSEENSLRGKLVQ